MTMIKITHEQGFTNKECLEEALATHGFLSKFAIVGVGDKYQLNITQSRRDVNRTIVENELKKELDEAIKTILPTYTKLLATDDFNAKGFYLKRETKDLEEETLVFEKIHAFSEKDVPEQIIIKIRRDYNLTVDTQNFTGNKCRETTRNFEDAIGQVIWREMKPEDTTNNRKLRNGQLLELTICR